MFKPITAQMFEENFAQHLTPGDVYTSFGNLHIPNSGAKESLAGRSNGAPRQTSHVVERTPHSVALIVPEDSSPSPLSCSKVVFTALLLGVLATNILFLSGFTFPTEYLAIANISAVLCLTFTGLNVEDLRLDPFKKFMLVALTIATVIFNAAALAGLPYIAVYQLSALGLTTAAAVIEHLINSQNDLGSTRSPSQPSMAPDT